MTLSTLAYGSLCLLGLLDLALLIPAVRREARGRYLALLGAFMLLVASVTVSAGQRLVAQTTPVWGNALAVAAEAVLAGTLGAFVARGRRR